MKLNEIYYIISIITALTLTLIYSVNRLTSERKSWGDSFFSYSIFRKFTLVETVSYLLFYAMGSAISVIVYFATANNEIVSPEAQTAVTKEIITDNIFTNNFQIFGNVFFAILAIISLIMIILYYKVLKEYTKAMTYKVSRNELLFRGVPLFITLISGLIAGIGFYTFTEMVHISMGVAIYFLVLFLVMLFITFFEMYVDHKRIKKAHIYIINDSTRVEGMILHEGSKMIVVKHSKGVSHINTNIIRSIVFID